MVDTSKPLADMIPFTSIDAADNTEWEFSEKGFAVVKFGLRLEFEYADQIDPDSGEISGLPT